MCEWTVRPEGQENVVMDSRQKMIAAAQRAARNLSRSEGTSHQSCLDVVARNVGRRHWTDFLADPVPIDEATRLSAGEPDHTRISHDAQLVACVEYALTLDSGSFMAGPSGPEGRTVMLYSGRGARFDHGVDARGVSLHALAASIRAAATVEDRARIEDVDVRWSIEDRRVGEDFLPVVTITLDDSDPVADQSLLEVDAPARTDRENELRRRAAATDRGVDEAPVPPDEERKGDLLDLLTLSSLRNGMYDIEIEPGRFEATIHYVSPSRRRLMRTIPLSQLSYLNAMSKDRGRIDQMETRVSQYGDWSYEIDGVMMTVHLATEPSHFGETVRLGFSPFVRRTYALNRTKEIPLDAGLLLGHAGLLRRTERRARAGELIVHSGSSQDHRDAFASNAVREVPNTDVLVYDPSGGVRAMIGERWIRSDNRLLIDPRDAGSSAFNPLHPDMMPHGIVDAASAIAEILMPGRMDGGGSGANGLMIALAEVLSSSAVARGAVRDDRGVVDLPMIGRAAMTIADDRRGTLVGLLTNEARDCERASMEFARIVAMATEDRIRIAGDLVEALSFCGDEHVAAILSPSDVHDGMVLARAVLLRRTPATIVVGGDDDAASILAAIALDATVRIRSDASGRAMHVHATRADDLPRMPWLGTVLHRGYTPYGITASIGLESPGAIWSHVALPPREASSDHGDRRKGLDGIGRWIVDDVTTARDREDIAKAMSVKASDVPVHSDPVRMMEVTRESTALLRRMD